jgi:hypothetical protein
MDVILTPTSAIHLNTTHLDTAFTSTPLTSILHSPQHPTHSNSLHLEGFGTPPPPSDNIDNVLQNQKSLMIHALATPLRSVDTCSSALLISSNFSNLQFLQCEVHSVQWALDRDLWTWIVPKSRLNKQGKKETSSSWYESVSKTHHRGEGWFLLHHQL